jgi:hypothetical protein
MLNENIVGSEHVLFLGAGASAPLGLLPTGPFLKLLQDRLHEMIAVEEGQRIQGAWQGPLSQLFTKAARYHRARTPDSELVLDYLEHLISTHRQLGELPVELSKLVGTGDASAFHRDWVIGLSRLRDRIQRVVAEHYSDVDGRNAFNLYEPLLDALTHQGSVVPIFSTNYDWTFEHLVEEVESRYVLVDGFRSSPTGDRWDRAVFDDLEPGNRPRLVLFKLHGSTSWYTEADSGVIRKFQASQPEIGGSRATLIYPTQVKAEAVSADPFGTAYDYLVAALSGARLCIVIGFSFRDPAINNTISRALIGNGRLRLVIVEPAINSDPGVDFTELLNRLGLAPDSWKRRVHVIKGRFGEDAFVSGEIARVVEKLDKWDELEPHWIDENEARLAATRH